MRILKAALVAVFLLMLGCAAACCEEVPALGIDFTPGKPVDKANYISKTEYEDPTIHVVIDTGRKDNCNYWVARVKIGHPSQLRTAAAGGFENEVTMNGVHLAKRQNAVLAVDGDYYAYFRYGYIMRQGNLYLNQLRADRDVLAIDEDGDFHIFLTPGPGTLTEEWEGKKLINVFHFGPALVIDGEVGTLSASGWMVPTEKRQRMCIAQTGPLEYMALCCAGPARGSEGMTLFQFAELAKELGAVNAYNLDGGDSTMMIFDGQKINDKDNAHTRDISDIIYFASAWDGE